MTKCPPILLLFFAFLWVSTFLLGGALLHMNQKGFSGGRCPISKGGGGVRASSLRLKLPPSHLIQAPPSEAVLPGLSWAPELSAARKRLVFSLAPHPLPATGTVKATPSRSTALVPSLPLRKLFPARLLCLSSLPGAPKSPSQGSTSQGWLHDTL